MLCLDSFSKQILDIWTPFRVISVYNMQQFEGKNSFSSGSFSHVHKVTDEALIVETAV